MKIDKQACRQAKRLFRLCLANGVLDEPRVRAVVASLASQRPRDYLGVLTHLHRLVRLDVQRRSARVECAAPLGPALEASLRESLGRRYGPGLRTTLVSNPALIGGLRIQVGSDVYDGSVQGRLARLAASL